MISIRRMLGRASQPEAVELPRGPLAIAMDAVGDEFVDIEAVADRLGIAVEQQPYRPELAGTIQRFGGKWVIGVNRADPLTRRRFTIAHEIGHYLAHVDLLEMRGAIPGTSDDHNYRQPEIEALVNPSLQERHERQANRIAVRLLMDATKMSRLIEEGLTSEQIAPLIGCSVEATVIRVAEVIRGLD